MPLNDFSENPVDKADILSSWCSQRNWTVVQAKAAWSKFQKDKLIWLSRNGWVLTSLGKVRLSKLGAAK